MKLKLKNLITGLAVFLLGILLLGSIPTEAATKKITITPATTKDCYDSVYVNITSPLKKSKVSKVELYNGKLTKASDKKWKNADSLYFYKNDDGTLISYFYADYNGTYSVRLTTTSGKKYVKTVKIKNILPASPYSGFEAVLKDISAPDSKGNCTITVDYIYPYNKTYDELYGLKVGDTVHFFEKEATITAMYSLNDEYDLVPIDAFSDDCRAIICKPKKWTDFFPADSEYYSSPENQLFGLLSNNGQLFYAYEDYEYGLDAYVTLDFIYEGNVKRTITKDTRYKPAYFDRERYPNGCEITIAEYLALKNDRSLQEEYGIGIYDGINFHIYDKYDKKTKSFTDVVDLISEIYTP